MLKICQYVHATARDRKPREVPRADEVSGRGSGRNLRHASDSDQPVPSGRLFDGQVARLATADSSAIARFLP